MKFKECLMSCYLSVRYFVLRSYYEWRMPTVLTTEETLKRIINNKVSISRYGDGELSVMQGGSIGFCKSNDELSLRLKQILLEPLPNLLVCIPRMIITQKDIVKKAKKFWRHHFAAEYPYWFKFLDTYTTYGNAICSRFYIGVQNVNFASSVIDLWRKVWDNKKCLLVEGANTRMGMGNDLMDNAKSIERILCPPTDAFDKYDKILDAVLRTIGDSRNEYVVLLALGPTATVLAYDLCKEGIQAVDCGHLDIEYEWFIQETPVRTNIPTKAVNEYWDNGLDVVNEVTANYEKEIICRI